MGVVSNEMGANIARHRWRKEWTEESDWLGDKRCRMQNAKVMETRECSERKW